MESVKVQPLIIITIFASCLIKDNDGLDILAQVPCERDPEGYVSPDPLYCDRYMECDPDGVKSIKTCDLGEKFDLNIADCNLEEEVDCQERTKTWSVDSEAVRIHRNNGDREQLLHIPNAPSTTNVDDDSPQRQIPNDDTLFGTRSRPNILGATSLFSTISPPPSSPSTDFDSDIIIPHDPLADIKCEGSDVYVVPDPSHCDRYLICPEGEIDLCSKGFTLDTVDGFCQPRSTVNCGDRDLNFRDNQEELEAKLEEKIRNLISGNSVKSETVSYKESRPLSETNDGSDSLIEHSNAQPLTSETFPVVTVEADNENSPTLLVTDDVLEEVLDEVLDLEETSKSPVKSLVFGQSQRPTGRPNIPPRYVTASTSRPNVPPRSFNHHNLVSNQVSENDAGQINTKAEIFERGNSNEVSGLTDDGLVLVDEVLCEATSIGYIVPDAEQCDKYAECFNGVKTILLCPDGFAFDLHHKHCDYLIKVNCSSRPRLQPPKSTRLCPRENGYYPMATEVSCSQYIDCRNGVGHVLSCGAGAVFDEVRGCVHPDETDRPGCTAEDKYNFRCPSGLGLRFGDHDRLPHPTDCSLFYACLRNGSPRLLSCQKPTVFNPQSGLCERQDLVPGCEDFYSPEELLHPAFLEERERLAQNIREQILREFNLLKKK